MSSLLDDMAGNNPDANIGESPNVIHNQGQETINHSSIKKGN